MAQDAAVVIKDDKDTETRDDERYQKSGLSARVRTGLLGPNFNQRLRLRHRRAAVQLGASRRDSVSQPTGDRRRRPVPRHVRRGQLRPRDGPPLARNVACRLKHPRKTRLRRQCERCSRHLGMCLRLLARVALQLRDRLAEQIVHFLTHRFRRGRVQGDAEPKGEVVPGAR